MVVGGGQDPLGQQLETRTEVRPGSFEGFDEFEGIFLGGQYGLGPFFALLVVFLCKEIGGKG